MQDIDNFITGFRQFHAKYFGGNRSLFGQLREGQRPKALIIACSDSRVDPALLTGAEPGDEFVVRNVANLVPPYEPGGTFASVPAALEFGVQSLGIEHIIVLGHARCGGIHALMNSDSLGGEFIGKWVSIARRARERVLAELPDKPPSMQERACEQASILVSLENLLTYPWIAERVANGRIQLHGWYFDMEQGSLLRYDPVRSTFDSFDAVEGASASDDR